MYFGRVKPLVRAADALVHLFGRSCAEQAVLEPPEKELEGQHNVFLFHSTNVPFELQLLLVLYVAR